MDPYFLPIDERALPDIQPPALTVPACHIRALCGFRVAKCLFDIGDDSAAPFADEGGEEELWANLGGSCHGARDGEEFSDLGCAEGADAGDEGEIVECDGEEFVGLLVDSPGPKIFGLAAAQGAASD